MLEVFQFLISAFRNCLIIQVGKSLNGVIPDDPIYNWMYPPPKSASVWTMLPSPPAPPLPQGVLCEHRQAAWYALAKAAAEKVDESSTVLLTAAITFDPCQVGSGVNRFSM